LNPLMMTLLMTLEIPQSKTFADSGFFLRDDNALRERQGGRRGDAQIRVFY
jgi:hypothetical protein